MAAEIEAKLKVDSLNGIAERLSELGAEYVDRQHQKDYYFDDFDRSFSKSDRCLRLRRQSTADTEKIFLTYKGPKEKTNLKKRQEIEIEVKDISSAEDLLGAIGFERTLVIEKERELWHLDNCIIALDELPVLGFFVEIEGPDEQLIIAVQKKLELANLPHITESYASLAVKNKSQIEK